MTLCTHSTLVLCSDPHAPPRGGKGLALFAELFLGSADSPSDIYMISILGDYYGIFNLVYSLSHMHKYTNTGGQLLDHNLIGSPGSRTVESECQTFPSLGGWGLGTRLLQHRLWACSIFSSLFYVLLESTIMSSCTYIATW